MSVFVPVPYCFDYYNFVVEFEIREHEIRELVYAAVTNSSHIFIYLFIYLTSLLEYNYFTIVC